MDEITQAAVALLTVGDTIFEVNRNWLIPRKITESNNGIITLNYSGFINPSNIYYNIDAHRYYINSKLITYA